MGIFRQPLNQNRQPNQRRDYNSGDSDYETDDDYFSSRSNNYNSNSYNSNNYSSNSYSRHDSYDDSDGDDGDDGGDD